MGLWVSAGRSSEPKLLSGRRWSPSCGSHNTTLFARIPQPKVSKTKLVAWVAGAYPGCCIFSAFGADLALHRRSPNDADGTSWLYRDLQVLSPNKKLGGYARNLVKPGGAKVYEKCALAHLPPDVSAAGSRIGVCNTLTSTVPVEFAVQVTGHDSKGVSAFYEYLKPYFALLMTGAIVLAGRPPFKWGTLGLGPRPASLAPIYALGVDATLLQTMIVAVFNLDSASPPEFRPAGSLWPLLEASFVSISVVRAPC